MRDKRKYIVLVAPITRDESQRIYEYMKYATCNYVIIDTTASYVEAYLTESWLDPVELLNTFKETISSRTRYFITELSGEYACRNPHCGLSKFTDFFK